jgi:macrolide-specific efflux system membrane fusion protein
MARSKKRFITYTILLLILAAAVGYGIYDYFKPQAPSYMTVHSEKRDINKQVFATGVISGMTEVDVGAQVSGQILKLHVETGDEVKQGDLLCEIDPSTQETALKKANAKLLSINAQIKAKQAEIKKLQLEYERQRNLRKANASSKQDFEAAEASLTIAKAELEELNSSYAQGQLDVDDAKTNLGYTKILAPIDGTVYATVVSEGQTVNANQTTPTILRLATMDHMKVETEISEADVVNVAPGMECTFTVLGLPHRNFTGVLGRIAPAPSSYESSSNSNSSSSSSSSSEAIYYNSDIEVENLDRVLRIDMTADVVINVVSKKQVQALAITALRSEGNDSATVYVLENGKVVEKELKVGIRDSQYVEIVSGLSPEDKVVIGDDVKTAESEALSNTRRRGPF